MRNEDIRSKKVMFASSCILNVNNKVKELARYRGAFKELLELMDEYDIGIQQMDCPETLFLGVNRWSAVKNLYDTPAFRRICREIAGRVADYTFSYIQAGYCVVGILLINGSPTCGCDMTCYDEKWGGTPTDFGNQSTFVEGKGILVEELIKTFEDRNIPLPELIGLNLEDMSISLHDSCNKLRNYLATRMEE